MITIGLHCNQLAWGYKNRTRKSFEWECTGERSIGAWSTTRSRPRKHLSFPRIVSTTLYIAIKS